MKFRHISFDVWNTLIEPNPEFGKARLRYLATELAMPVDEVEAVYRRVKDGADRAAEIAGAGMSSEGVYQHFFTELGRPEADWHALRAGFERLFSKHAPIVLPETIMTLRALQAAGFGLSIGSNTNFIQGSCLHDVALGTWGVDWSFQVFSDLFGYAKPHPRFWKEVKANAFALSGAKPHETVHVGDNIICDGGCRPHQIRFVHVKGPADLPEALKEFLVYA